MMFQLKEIKPGALAQYLKRRKWLSKNEQVHSISIPGAGNMNYVVRVNTGDRTFILKQSSGFVEKYPQVAAPANRAVTEGQFYKTVSSHAALQSLMPTLLGMDKANNLLVLEDLGETADFVFLYDLNQKLAENEICDLVNYLNILHSSFQVSTGVRKIANLNMRRLNHEHIFRYPFLEENGFNLDGIQPGLQSLAMPFKKDIALKKTVAELGKVYLSKGDTLLHGDFYPGSWLKTTRGIQVIDPEFCFHGRREFDVSVMIAHLRLTQHDEPLIAAVLKNYKFTDQLNFRLLDQFIGVEVMRRLIGLAQLPLKADLPFKQNLLEKSRQLILA